MTDVPPSRRSVREAAQRQAALEAEQNAEVPAVDPHDPLENLFAGPAIPPAPEREATGRRQARAQGKPRGRSRSPYQQAEKPRGRKRRLLIGLLAVGVFFAMIAVAVVIFIEPVRALFATPESDDYVGTGTGEVMFTIHDGDTGDDITTNLVEADVIKTYSPFYSLLLAQSPEPVFQPGAYLMAGQMSAKAALAKLQDPATRQENTFFIAEGDVMANVLPDIANGTGVALADLQAAAADYGSYGLPAGATSLEGFLFPATYDIQPGTSAHDILQTLVDRTFQSLDAAGVPVDDRYRVIVFASLVQREAGLRDDYPKVARVFQNRLDQGMLLQSDATVAYGSGQTHRVTTTDAERADANNAYNTYVHPGLPVGPISNPGDIAIDAVMHPADGSWLYFVTVNLDSGETVFSTTLAEHEAAVAQWQSWMADHPEYQ